MGNELEKKMREDEERLGIPVVGRYGCAMVYTMGTWVKNGSKMGQKLGWCVIVSLSPDEQGY